MKRFLVLAFAVLLNLQPFASADEKAVEIPLKEIWGVNMPGTKDIGKFSSERAAEESIVTKTIRQIQDSWNHDRGMAVQGEGLKAVEEIYHNRTEELPRNKVSADAPVSLIFYTAGVGFYTHIKEVKRRGNTFTIRYRFTPHQTQDITQHLAVIPIGRVSPGKYKVNVEQLPLEKQFVDLGYVVTPRRTEQVCRSFSFHVLKPEVKQ